MEKREDIPFDPILIARYRRMFQRIMIFTLFLVGNGIFSFGNKEGFPWILVIVLSYTSLCLKINENSNIVQFAARFMNGALGISGIIMFIQITVMDTASSTLYALQTKEAFFFLITACGMTLLAEPIVTFSPMLGVFWGIIEACYIVCMWIFMKIRGKQLLGIMWSSVISIVKEALVNPNIFIFFSWKLLTVYFIMHVVELSWKGVWTSYFYLGLVLVCFLVSNVIGYCSFMYTVITALFAYPCKWVLQRFVDINILLFICISILGLILVEFALRCSGMFTNYLSNESIFIYVFYGMQNDQFIPTQAYDMPHANSTSTNSSFFTVMEKVGTFAYSMYEIGTGAKESIFTKVFTRRFWREWLSMFIFVYDLPDITLVFAHFAVYVFETTITVFLGSLHFLQLIFGVLTPVACIILLEKMELVIDMFHEILRFRKRTRSQKHREGGDKKVQ